MRCGCGRPELRRSAETELLWEARLAGQAPEIDGVCYVNDFPDGGEPAPGQFRRLRVSEAHDYDLVGGLVDSGEVAGEVVAPFPILAVPRSQSTPLAR